MSLLGFTKTCAAHSAGVSTLYLATAADVTSFTLASGEDYYDTITMESSKVFKAYDFEQDTAVLTVESVRENDAQKHTAQIVFRMGKMTKEVRTSLQELFDNSNCGMIAIVLDSNGAMQVLGYTEGLLKTRPLKVTAGSGTTGAGLTDESGTTLTLACESKLLPPFFTGTVPLT